MRSMETKLWLCCRDTCTYVVAGTEEEAAEVYRKYKGGGEVDCMYFLDIIVEGDAHAQHE